MAQKMYGVSEVRERHRHRYEFNNAYRERLLAKGFVLSGLSPDGRLVEIIELKDHPWFLATQFHPEYNSRPHRPHPLFSGFVGAASAPQVRPCRWDAETGFQLRSRLVEILNVPQRVRLRFRFACGLVERLV